MKNFKLDNRFFLQKICLLIFIIFLLIHLIFFKAKLKKVGIVGLRHETNIGNNLIKYAMSIKISQLGYIPYIIGTVWNRFNNIDFINQTTNLVIIEKNYSEIKQNDYDILIVNSDQTWVKFDYNFYNYAFLKFAENWTIPKFIYGASLGYDKWVFSKNDEKIAKNLLSNFSGISVREKGSIELIKKHLGINAQLVLDPTFLIDNKYYLKLIRDFKGNLTKDNSYIFIYNIADDQNIIKIMKNSSKELNLGTFYFPLNNDSSVLSFIYYIVNSNSVITNSYHGSVFSIIFNKPFLTIYEKNSAKERYISLGSLFNVSERIVEVGEYLDLNLLKKPLNINQKLLNKLKKESINFLKENLKQK